MAARTIGVVGAGTMGTGIAQLAVRSGAQTLLLDAARLMVWRAGALKDAGKPNTTETSMAKLLASETAIWCADRGIQIHGGSGYSDEFRVERYLRDARVATLYEGTSQIQKLIIGRALTGVNAMVPS